MPICYQPNDRQRALPPVPTRASQGLPEGRLVLCGFNQPFKISPEVFDSWCRLLHALPDAVLWLLEWNKQALPNLRNEAVKRGIDPARLIGAKRLDSHDHIARFRLADIFLDTWPCNAHTTASDGAVGRRTDRDDARRDLRGARRRQPAERGRHARAGVP